MPVRSPVYLPVRTPLVNRLGRTNLPWSGGGDAPSPPASLDIRASVGTSTSPTSTGTKAVTGVGFTPKVVLPWTVFHSASAATTEIGMNFGAGLSSSNRAAVAVASRHAVTTSTTHRRHENSKIITECYNGATTATWDLTSLDADGFTADTTSNGVAWIANHICLGGADLEVSLVQCQMNGTNAAQSFAHGLSGAPTGVLFFSSVDAAVPPNTATTLLMNIGGWAGSNQFGATVFAGNGLTTTTTTRVLANGRVFTQLFNGTAFRGMAVSSVDATNVNVTYPITTATNQSYFWMLAIRGAKCQVGTFDCNGSTSPLTINTPDITPKLFLPVFVPEGVDNLGSVRGDLALAIGASDGTNNVSCGISDQNGVTTTDARRWQSSTSLKEYWGGAVTFEATAAFSGNSVILTPTTATSAIWSQGAYLILGS